MWNTFVQLWFSPQMAGHACLVRVYIFTRVTRLIGPEPNVGTRAVYTRLSAGEPRNSVSNWEGSRTFDDGVCGVKLRR